ncbi:MAG: VOC family protein [Candidatus Heimdallarchaeota archaeon]
MVNDICHVEIPILEKEKAKNFYQAIFGWQLDFEMLPNYALYTGENGVSIGFPIVDELPLSTSSIWIEVDDIEAKLKAIEEAGGEIISEKSQISPEIGYSAKFTDCFGTHLGLYSRT